MNIHKWKFCTFCGSQDIAVDANACTCASCRRTAYENVATTCSVALYTEDGQIVLCERAREPYKGKYDLPGGYVDPEESGEQAIARELMEELEFAIDPEKLTLLLTAPGTYPSGEDASTAFLDLSYAYKITKEECGNMKALDDVAAITLIAIDKIKRNHLAWDHDVLTMSAVQKNLI